MSIKFSLDISADGTGGAFAVDHQNKVSRYIQSVNESDIELKHRAVRLLVPIVYGLKSENEPNTVALGKTVRHLEFNKRTIFVLVARDKINEKSWQEDLSEYQNLVQKCLGWNTLPVPYDQQMPLETHTLISAILKEMQSTWESERAIRSNTDTDCLEKILAATSPSKEDLLTVHKLATEAYASRDYGRKRLASFAEYIARNPITTIVDLAADFHRNTLDGNKIAASIDDSIKRRKPFSFIRVGEGEGCFLSYKKYQNHRDGTHEVFGVCAKDIYRIWFDRDIHQASADELDSIRHLFWSAIEVADVIGVPTQERVIYEYAHFLGDMERYGYSRGYVGVAEILSHLTQAREKGLVRTPLFADCDIARPLYEWQDWSKALICTLPRILKGKKDVTFVTCHPQLEVALQRVLGLSKTRTMLIPPERGRVKGQGLMAGDHFFDHFQRINEELLRDPGAIVIVAGGFLGKAYCATAKAASAVAIDIGSLADYWVGATTRAKNAWTIPSPFQINLRLK